MEFDFIKVAEEVNKDDTMPGKIKYDLRDKINSLNSVDHINLFKIVYKYSQKKVYTTNNRGTFFDLNDLDNKILWKLQKYVALVLNKIEQDKIIEKEEHERKITELTLKNRPREKNDTLIPGVNKQKNTAFEELISAGVLNNNLQSVKIGLANIVTNDVQNDAKSFVGGSLCITDDDLNSEALDTTDTTDNTVDNNTINTSLPDDDDDDDDEGNLEDEDEDEDEDKYELDPSQVIKNGGREYLAE